MSLADDLARDGYAGPLRLFTPDQCAALLQRMRTETRRVNLWDKDRAVDGPAFYEAGTNAVLIETLRDMLGEDLVLWGASLIVKQGNEVHPFHSDVESMAPEGGFVTAWIGLSNTQRESGLKFIRGSHRYGVTAQEANHRRGIARDASSEDTALAAARELDADAELVQPDVSIGEAMLFDGRIWHGSRNEAGTTRTALLLQYARADRPVYLPAHFGWPIEHRAEPRPPVLVVSGKAPIGVNRVVTGPLQQVPNAAFALAPPPDVAPSRFASIGHFHGQTPALLDLEGHSSLLAPGQSPHPLHSHVEEEILVVLAGAAELHTAADGAGAGLVTSAMGPGDFAYYPARQWHTIVNSSDRPVLYTMLKWSGAAERKLRRGDELQLIRAGDMLRQAADPNAFNRGAVLDVASRWLGRLHGHVSVLAAGAGYEAHTDPYDVAILLIEGTIETLGQTLSAPALLYHPAGAPHGLRASGDGPARYLAFELHGAAADEPVSRRRLARLARRGKDLARKVLRPIKRLLRA